MSFLSRQRRPSLTEVGMCGMGGLVVSLQQAELGRHRSFRVLDEESDGRWLGFRMIPHTLAFG
jgi:hypothetical protein